MADSCPNIGYSVLGSLLVAGSMLVVSVVSFYRFFTSKYGRWKKDLDQLAKAMQKLPGVPTQIEYADINKATNNFHEATTLGKGGFGAVYRCKLPDPGTEQALLEVAVKKFTRRKQKNNRYDDFLAEVSVIHRLSHKNIVPLIDPGWSYYKGEALLVYEYMSNGSLDQHLFRSGPTTLQQENTAVLPWKTRYDIVRDIATGLRYIHHEHEPMVLHRDIKASNIMLDSNLRGRLGDFGIACTVDVNKSSVSFQGKILGARGYIAPEYKESCEATRQSDIYAFGVLVLEIVTGRQQWDDDGGDDGITGWVLRFRREGKLFQTVDRIVLTAGEDDNDSQSQAVIAEAAERMLLLGLKCTDLNPCSRPSMEDVVQEIAKSAPAPDVSPHRSTSPSLPPTQDLRSMSKSFYGTAATHLEATASSPTMELALLASEEQPSSADTRGHVSFYDSVV